MLAFVQFWKLIRVEGGCAMQPLWVESQWGPGHLSPNLGLRELQTTENQLLTGNLCSQHREEINKSAQEH